MTKSLQQLQLATEALDQQLLQLLAERRQLTKAQLQQQIKQQLPLRDRQQDLQQLKAILQAGKPLQLDEIYLSRLYQIIQEDAAIMQQKLLQAELNHQTLRSAKVAFLGPKGSYSHLAARRYAAIHFDKMLECGCSNFQTVFQQAEEGFVDCCIVPLENSSSGSINEVYDLLQKTALHIIAEVALPIDHCILVKPGSDLAQIKTVYSHPQPFQQCSNFLNDYPDWKIIYCDSTSSAMQTVAELNDPTVAAIGNREGGELYGLQMLEHNFANQKENITRFVVLARQPIEVADSLPAKTTILFKTGQQPGALVDALLVLRQHQIAMTKLESRPIHGNPWEEMFYLDLQANLATVAMQQALKELASITLFTKVLGCYPSDSQLPLV